MVTGRTHKQSQACRETRGFVGLLCRCGARAVLGIAATAAHAQQVTSTPSGNAPVVAVEPRSATQEAPALRAPASELVLRAGVASVQGEVIELSLQGVCVADGASQRWLSWDLVRSVPTIFAAQGKEFEGIAENAWRARTRLSRADVSGAEPLFEQLGPQYAGTRGSTSAMVAAGLLRCRLHRQAQVASVEAWLWLLASGENAPAFAPLREDITLPQRTLLDREMLLCPDLPPLWVPGAGVRALRMELAVNTTGTRANEPAQRTDAKSATNASKPQSDGEFRVMRRLAVAAVLVELYELSAKHAMGENVTLPARPASDAGPEFVGARLVWDVLAAQAGSAEQISQARAHLADILATIEQDDTAYAGWVEAWVRTALGRSLMASSLSEERATGIAISLAVPALLADDSRYLAGLCLSDVASLRVRQGQLASAKVLRDELRRISPQHPALPALETALNTAAVAAAGGKP